MVNKNEIRNDSAVVPNLSLPPKLTVTSFDCDENLTQYAETLLCDGDDAICYMTVQDKAGNEVGFDLRIRGEVRVGWRDNVNDDFTYYKHYSQFPPELTKAIKSGEYYEDEHVWVDMNNWLETVYYINDESIDGIMFEENIADMSPADVKTKILEYASWVFESCYDDGTFTRPEVYK